MTTFALVGFGFRAAAVHRVAQALTEVDCVGAVVRDPRRRSLPVPAFADLAACVRETRPDFLVTAVPKVVNPAVIAEAVALQIPVLAETPPAPGRPGLRELWATVGASGLVQVAEQYLLMPTHAARLAAARTGIIGAPTQVQVSSTQQYHAMSLIRGLLGVGHAPAAVRAVRTVAPLLDPLGRGGWTGDTEPKPATTTIATLDFGGGRSAVYDFTTNQTRNLLRFRRLLVRGTHGELRDDEVVHLAAPQTIARTAIVRRQSGHDLDLNGFDTETIMLGDRVLYRNPYAGCRFNDDEIATATLLDAMAAWVRGAGPPPYPLAVGAQDHLLALAVEEAADTGREVVTAAEAWSPA
ncbi:gfo/Idh/MocA family oxidoreductase [Paractinoplanes lichenicola]|uniref:Gfo/Idh/MocA family oxidoreductase n=1 Tax=Paractinoplanes lichenicola TaxID=2802976 RepID=A0ABS1W561_9ACTN|nr:gfo/Idh/MocA family oxidoreductase [Actinoplanes lichenicola]MBL7261864.1 gfo/Idh/MocA family oxidoreductase [Actinoplanes lichenicola]